MFQFSLNEEIFNREETKLIDQEFKIINDWYQSVDIKTVLNTDLNIKFQKELSNIEKHILKLFNAKIIFKFDDASNPKVLNYGMMIFPSMQELKGKIRDAVEKNKEGFYLRSCSNVLVVMDLGLLTLLKKYEKNERYLTAVILHELGHKIYVKSQHEVRQKAQDTNTLIALTVFGMSFVISFTALAFILPCIFMIGGIQVMNIVNTKAYVDSEHLSDVIGVKYGYGSETYELMDMFYNLTKDKRNSKIKIVRQMANMWNASKMRRDEVEKALKKELQDPRNSKVQKDLIKSSLKELQKVKTE